MTPIPSLYLLLSFFSGLGDTVFLSGVPLYLFQLGNSQLSYAALVPFTIIATIVIFKKLIFAINHLNPIKLVALGEIAIGVIEVLILVLVDFVDKKEVVLVIGLIPLALIYNLYSASKRLKIQDYFFKKNRIVLNGFHSTSDRVGRIVGVFVAGNLLANAGIKGILIFDAISFFAFGGFMLLYYQYGDRNPAPVTLGLSDEEVNVIPTNRAFEFSLFVGLIALNLAASWESSSLLPAVQKTSQLPIDTLSGVKALSAAAGMILGLGIIKLKPNVISTMAMALVIFYSFLCIIELSPYYFFVISSVGFGLLGILSVSIQRGFIKKLSVEGRSFSEVATRFWYLQVLTGLTVLPLNFSLDQFNFAEPYAVAIAVCLLTGTAIGTFSSTAFLFKKREFFSNHPLDKGW